MWSDQLHVSPEEIRTRAEHSGRTWLAARGGLGLLLAAILWLVLPLLLGQQAGIFDPRPCVGDPTTPACVAHMPEHLSRLPDKDQYTRWRTVDLVTAIEREGTGGDLHRKISDELLALDPWLVDRGEHGPAPVALASERDWTAQPPVLPPAVSPEEESQRRSVGYALVSVRPLLEQRRLELLRSEGLPALFDGAKRAREQQKRQIQIAQGLLAALGVLVVVYSCAKWALSWPVEVVVGMHALRIGRHTWSWSELESVDWSTLSVRTHRGTCSLQGYRVPGGARGMLERSTEQALARARESGPLDRQALERVQRLLQ